MAIAYRSQTSTAKTGTTDGIITLASLPSGTADGDCLIVGISTNAGNITGIPTGWTEFGKIPSGTLNNPRIQGYWRFWHTGDPTTWDWTMSSNVAAGLICAAFSGVDPTTPLDVTEVTSTNTTGTTLATASLTPSTSGSMLVSWFGANSSSVTITAPSGTNDIGSVGGKKGDMAYLAWDNSGSEAWTWTINSSLAKGTWFVPLRPASATAIPPGYAFII